MKSSSSDPKTWSGAGPGTRIMSRFPGCTVGVRVVAVVLRVAEAVSVILGEMEELEGSGRVM